MRGMIFSPENPDKLKALAKRRGVTVTPSDITQNPDRIITMIHSGKYDGGRILLQHVSIKHESYGQSLDLLNALVDHNMGILTPDIDVAPERIFDRMAKKVQTKHVKRMRNKSRAKMIATKRAHKISGQYMGPAPLGSYRKNNHYHKNPETWPLVEYIFNNPHKSAMEISREFEAEGYQGKRGGHISPSSIIYIRKNLIYTGYMLSEQGFKIPAANVDFDIPVEMYELNQAANKPTSTGHNTHGKYLLSGLMTCMKCGSKINIHVRKHKKYNYTYYGYRCVGTRRDCTAPIRKMEDIDDAVSLFFRDFVLSEKNVHALYAASDKVKESAAAKIEQLADRQFALNRGITSTLDAISRDILTEQAEKEYTRMLNERTEIEKDLLLLRENTNIFPEKRPWREMRDNFNSMDTKARRATMEYFTESMVYLWTEDDDLGVAITLKGRHPSLSTAEPIIKNGDLIDIPTILGPHLITVHGSETRLSRILYTLHS